MKTPDQIIALANERILRELPTAFPPVRVNGQKITEFREVRDSAGRRFLGRVNGKPFLVWRHQSNGSVGNRYSRGLANVPANWKIDTSSYERIDGRSVKCDHTTRAERVAAKAHAMTFVFPAK
jgi:hypothetical protein